MKRIVQAATIGAAIFAPFTAFAQEDAMDSYSFVNSLSLWGAVIIGLVASIMVLMNAKKMQGGMFGGVLKYFGIGMFLVVLGFLAVVVPPWADGNVIMRVHDLAFVIGYIFMAMGAKKLLAAGK